MGVLEINDKVIRRTTGTSAGATNTGSGWHVPIAATLKGLGNATIEAMYLPITAPVSLNVSVYSELTSSTTLTRIGMFFSPSGILCIYRDTETGTSFSFTWPIPKLSVWYHLALTVDATTNVLSLYVNGVLVQSNTTAKGNMTNTDPAGIFVFKNNASSDSYACRMDYVRVWTATRTQAEIEANMYKILPIQAQLKLQYTFDETGDPKDLSGNGYHAITAAGIITKAPSTSPAKSKILKR